MDPLPICLVGCGGMGSRHVKGIAALVGAGYSNIDLVACCDVRRDNAERVAAEAHAALGKRPRVHLSIEEAVADPDIATFDVVTEASSHLAVVVTALAAGKHVLCEKPLALTIRSCRALIGAAERGGAILATAENYRRDPMNRLAKAVIESGRLGHIHLMIQHAIGGNDRITITPWRHLKEKGAIGLDMGAHFADLIQYYLGPITAMYGRGFIAEPVRYKQAAPELATEAYLTRFAEIPDQVTATGEDSFFATYVTETGVPAQVAYVPSGPGRMYVQRTVHGRAGSLEVFGDRTGASPILHTAGGYLAGAALAAEIGFRLDPLTELLFGAELPYERSFEQADAGLIALELHDFAEAVRTGRAPEVDGHAGMTAVAAVLGVYESGLLGAPVSMADVLQGRVSRYQDDIDDGLGLRGPAFHAA